MYPIQREEDYGNPAVVESGDGFKWFRALFLPLDYPLSTNENRKFLSTTISEFTSTAGEFLQTLANLSPTPLELEESLEQLRVLEHGYKIKVVKTCCKDSEFVGHSVDTEDDVRRAEELLQDRGGSGAWVAINDRSILFSCN